eukprot:CAMPEP_0118925612 /NCGR_PEP_ID=MMETSP1169-20130426/3479_1 /TAXON_ID=36882 /ORGANISM="Pyramimonas obovata, Strain CCMP722" /LENGTH=243 /DNA_ID=CAMNT_0006866961 /DNA_START=30 /DNA_END=758 /DNA_ORIENTATION=-
MFGTTGKSLQAKPAKQSREFKNAIAEDKLRSQVNDAKIKAMHDLVDYDTFKNRVSVAHLRPLQADNLRTDVGCSPASLFNPDGTKISAIEADMVNAAALTTSAPQQLPKSSQDFEREWKRNCPTSVDKYKYFLFVPPDLFPQIFKVEITPTMLTDIIVVVNENALQKTGDDAQDCCTSEEMLHIARALSALTGVGRFSLTSRLLAPKAKQALSAIFDRLKAAGASVPNFGYSSEELDTLRAKW